MMYEWYTCRFGCPYETASPEMMRRHYAEKHPPPTTSEPKPEEKKND